MSAGLALIDMARMKIGDTAIVYDEPKAKFVCATTPSHEPLGRNMSDQ